jgi:hypothetical protein
MKWSKTYKVYRKQLKRYLLGKDDHGKKLYPHDSVKLKANMEMKTPWYSRVYWNPLDGAFVDSHPGHVKMGLSTYRSLREFINNQSEITITIDEDNEEQRPLYEIEKVTYKEYLEWENSRKTK